MGLSGHGGTDSVNHTETKGTTFQAVSKSKDGIGRLTGLRNEKANIITEDGGLAVQEIRGKLDRDGNLGQLFKDGTSSQAGMVRGTTCGHDDSAATTDCVEKGSKTAKLDLTLVKVDTTTHRVDDRVGLLVDLLLHKVVKGALHDLGQLHLQSLDGTHGAKAIVSSQSVNVELTLGNVSDIVVLEVEDTLSVLNDSGGVGSNEILDGLGETVLGQESTGLRAEELVVGVGDGERARARGVGARRSKETSIAETRLFNSTTELDVNKVDLELLLGLDTDQKGRTSTSNDNLSGKVNRLENKGESTLELLDDALDERGKVGLAALSRVVEVLAENGYGFSVGLALKLEAALLENHPELPKVGDDTVVDDSELVGWVGSVRVAVDRAGLTVSGPTGVGQTHLGDRDLAEVNGRLVNMLAESSDLADLLENESVPLCVTINGNTGRVVTSVFETSKTVDKNVYDLLAVLLHQVVDVSENAALL